MSSRSKRIAIRARLLCPVERGSLRAGFASDRQGKRGVLLAARDMQSEFDVKVHLYLTSCSNGPDLPTCLQYNERSEEQLTVSLETSAPHAADW